MVEMAEAVEVQTGVMDPEVLVEVEVEVALLRLERSLLHLMWGQDGATMVLSDGRPR